MFLSKRIMKRRNWGMSIDKGDKWMKEKLFCRDLLGNGGAYRRGKYLHVRSVLWWFVRRQRAEDYVRGMDRSSVKRHRFCSFKSCSR